MALRRGIYIVPTNGWYIERTVWLMAGIALLASTALALLVHPLVLGVIATGAFSITVAPASHASRPWPASVVFFAGGTPPCSAIARAHSAPATGITIASADTIAEVAAS